MFHRVFVRVGPVALLALAGVLPSLAETPRALVDQILAARAEMPAEPRSLEQAAPLGTPSPQRLFFMTGADNAPCVRSITDVTGDGRDEVIVGIDESQVDNIFALDGASAGAATVVWSVETMSGVSGGSPWGDQSLVPIGDTDGNGHPNILVGTAWGGRTAFNFDGLDGTELWRLDTYTEPASGWVYSLAELNDISGDGVPEVAFGVGSDNDGVYLIDGASGGAATTRWRYNAPDAVLSVRSAGDVNGDGDHDVLAAVGDNGDVLLCLDGGSGSPAGGALWSYPGGATVYATGTIPDLTGDGVAEAVAVMWVSDGSAVRVLNGATGAMVWTSTAVNSFGTMVDLLGDVTGDGVPEIAVGSFERAATVLNGADGTLVWKTFVGTLNGGDVWTIRGIDDLNGDGRRDVVAGSFDYHVYAFDGDDGTVLWAYDTGNRVFSVYPVGDLDGDGVADVAVGTQDTNNSVVVSVLSGKAASSSLFADGFESGDTSAWTTTVP